MKTKLMMIGIVLSFFISTSVVYAEDIGLKLETRKSNMNLDELYSIDIVNNINDIVNGSFLLTINSDLVKIERLEFNDKLDVELDANKVKFKIKDNNKTLEKQQKLGTILLKATKQAKNKSKVKISLSDISITTTNNNKVLKLPKVSTSFELTSLSSNTNLKSLHSKFVRMDYSKEKTIYKVEVSSDVDEFDLVAETEDDKAKVEISNQKLQSTITTIYITVTAENGDKKQYKVIVSKQLLADDEEEKVDEKTTKKIWCYIIIASSIIILIDLGYIYYKNR